MARKPKSKTPDQAPEENGGDVFTELENMGPSAGPTTGLPGMPGQDFMSGPTDDNEEFEMDYVEKEPMAAGRHMFQCVELETGTSKAGNPQFITTWMCIHPEADRGEKLKYYTATIPSARWKVADMLRAAGVPIEGSMLKFKRSDLVGKVCAGMTVVEPYQGRDSAKLQSILPLTDEEQLMVPELLAAPLI